MKSCKGTQNYAPLIENWDMAVIAAVFVGKPHCYFFPVLTAAVGGGAVGDVDVGDPVVDGNQEVFAEGRTVLAVQLDRPFGVSEGGVDDFDAAFNAAEAVGVAAGAVDGDLDADEGDEAVVGVGGRVAGGVAELDLEVVCGAEGEDAFEDEEGCAAVHIGAGAADGVRQGDCDGAGVIIVSGAGSDAGNGEWVVEHLVIGLEEAAGTVDAWSGGADDCVGAAAADRHEDHGGAVGGGAADSFELRKREAGAALNEARREDRRSVAQAAAPGGVEFDGWIAG